MRVARVCLIVAIGIPPVVLYSTTVISARKRMSPGKPSRSGYVAGSPHKHTSALASGNTAVKGKQRMANCD